MTDLTDSPAMQAIDRLEQMGIEWPIGPAMALSIIERLKEEVERLQGAIEAYFNFAPGGYVMWEKLTNELREKDATIATLRGELDKQIDLNEGYVDTATALREALENEWRIAHNDYCGCSLDGRMKCDHPKPKALATEATQ